jgi:hypothetical protein
MDLNSYLAIGQIAITGIVGVILSRQIKSQSTIINHYKGLVNSYKPDKAIKLKDIEIEQLKKIADNDITNSGQRFLNLVTTLTSFLRQARTQLKHITNQKCLFVNL